MGDVILAQQNAICLCQQFLNTLPVNIDSSAITLMWKYQASYRWVGSGGGGKQKDY